MNELRHNLLHHSLRVRGGTKA